MIGVTRGRQGSGGAGAGQSMTEIRVDLGARSYSIVAGSGLLRRAGRLLSSVSSGRHMVLVSSPRLLRLHGTVLLQALKRSFARFDVIRIGDGEEQKNHATLTRVYDGLLRAGADRRSLLVAFGGGVVGDLAGYAAATFMRGIPYAGIPTTLLAQVDSSVGGKVGINLPQGKNLVGAFHHPVAVIADDAVLGTLPGRELRAGLYEVVKCGAIRSTDLLAFVERNLDGILACRDSLMHRIVVDSCRIKADVVVEDEREDSVRAILNFGHTIGHALEAATDYRRFRHGEAVAWGMIGAAVFGKELGLTDAQESARLTGLIRRIGKLPGLAGLGHREVWHALVRDKKFRGGRAKMILLAALGEARVYDGLDAAHLEDFLRRFLAAGGRMD